MICPVCGCPKQRKWLRVQTIARVLGCCPRTIRRMIQRGELDACKVGRDWRVEHWSLDAHIRSTAA